LVGTLRFFVTHQKIYQLGRALTLVKQEVVVIYYLEIKGGHYEEARGKRDCKRVGELNQRE
jgi:hypothetical protein